MIIELLKKILPKKNVVEQTTKPVFQITETILDKSDFEITELSYDEYVKYGAQERRHTSRAVVYDRRNLSGRKHQAQSSSF